MVNMIKDIRKEFGNPNMAVSIPVSGLTAPYDLDLQIHLYIYANWKPHSALPS